VTWIRNVVFLTVKEWSTLTIRGITVATRCFGRISRLVNSAQARQAPCQGYSAVGGRSRSSASDFQEFASKIPRICSNICSTKSRGRRSARCETALAADQRICVSYRSGSARSYKITLNKVLNLVLKQLKCIRNSRLDLLGHIEVDYLGLLLDGWLLQQETPGCIDY